MDNAALHEEFIRAMERFRQLKPPNAMGDFPKGAFFLLEMLHRNQAANPQSKGLFGSALATQIHMSPPAISRMLRTLEAEGYIGRSTDPQDRRNTYIRITPQGEAMLAQAKAQMFAFTSAVIDKMGCENMQTLIHLWNRLADTMEDEIKQSS